jgi:putative phosphoesterase
MRDELRVGLISDTHGLLRPEAVAALRGADFIVHAGDIGTPDILDALATIAPVTAVRGNNDIGAWASPLPDTATLGAGDARVYVIHNLSQLDIDPAATGLHAVISGHSHRPASSERNGVVYVNPGSAGPRRFKLPVSVGELVICRAGIRARIITLMT